MTPLDTYPMSLLDKADKTRYDYMRAAQRFIGWLGARELSQPALDEYISLLQERATGCGFRSSLLQLIPFVRHLQSTGVLLQTPPIPKLHAGIPRSITSAEYTKIQKATREPHHKLCWALMFRLGLRIGEVLRLRWQDVDVTEGVISVLRKGGDWQIIPYRLEQGDLDVDLTRMMETEPYRGEYLMTSRRTGKLCSAQAVRSAFSSACERAGVPAASPHAFRHGFAHASVKRGVNAFVLQQFLGHSSPNTTASYLKRVGGDVAILRRALQPGHS